MKTVKILGIALFVSFFAGGICHAQKETVTIVVKGIKEAKGKLMVAFGDKSHPKEMIYSMIPVSSKEAVVCVLKDVPVGIGDLSVYQDVNENLQLDKDENQIPVEPCYTKPKITIKEGDNKIEIKLINVKEMMGEKRP
jgi:uncharacterized protein (DUF2141 family)